MLYFRISSSKKHEMALKKFKPKNLDEYVELKPGIWARRDRIDVPISKVSEEGSAVSMEQN